MAITALAKVSAAARPSPPPITPVYSALKRAWQGDVNLIDGGIYRIRATVKIKGEPDVPAKRKVVLHDGISSRVVDSTWSDAVTGIYEFPNIRNGPFYVVAFDHTGGKRATIADNLTFENGGLELMP